MPIVPLSKLLKHASDNHYAVGAFVSMNIEIVQAAIGAAERKRSPVVIRLHPDARAITRLDTLGLVARHLAAEATVPVGISLDHGHTLGDTIDAMRAGCTSVMLDCAELPLEENIRLVREVVAAAEPLGVLVEAAVGNMEHGAVQTDNDLADVGEASRLVRESGATILAPAIGNVHGLAHGGAAKATPNLAIDRIRELRRATGVPISMHGGSSTPPEQMKEATRAGVALVILFTDIITAFNVALKKVLNANSDGVSIIRALIPAQRAAQAVIEGKMDDLGSTGQAGDFLRWYGEHEK
jgi:fructose-bisphosphate aldolase class II